MIHIVYNHGDIDTLKAAIELDPSLQGDVIQVRDDYAVGPIEGIYTEEGYKARKAWWMEVLKDGDYDGLVEKNEVNDPAVVANLVTRLNEDPSEVIWIWAAQNKHDVCGYYWLMSQLKAYQGRVFILYLNNLPFINEKGQIFYPEWVFQIPPREFTKAKKLARPITLSEFEVDPDEWKRLTTENAMIRILEGGKKIAGKEADLYDKDILENLTKEFQKGNKAMANILGKMKIKTGDVFLLWRMKKLAEDGKIEINGDTTLEPLAAGIAVDSFDKDSNALDVPRVARHDSEHSIFRIRARLRADSVLVTGHHDAFHICQERQGRRQAPMPRRH